MPIYEYRCSSCRDVFSLERSMHDDESTVACTSCGNTKVARIWNAFIRASGIKADAGQNNTTTGTSQAGSSCSHSCSCH